MPNTKTRTRDVNAAQRAVQALKLRAQKMTFDEIAKQCGYASRGACHDAIMREMSRVVVENVEQLRHEELLTLDQLQVECYAMAMDKRYKGRLFAVDRVLAIMERRAKLMGLDVPTGSNLAMNQVFIREVPAGYFGLPIAEAPHDQT